MKARIVLNRKAVSEELLKGDAIMDHIESIGKKFAYQCGEGYATSRYIGRNRGNVSVYAETSAAEKDNLENNTLLKVTGA